MNTTFQWQDFGHFYNTVKKRIREQLGSGFEFDELEDICGFLFFTSININLDEYMNPTGVFIAEIKQVKTPDNYLELMKKYWRILENESIDYFKIGTPKLKKRNQTFDELFVSFKGGKKFVVKTNNQLIPDQPGVYFLFNSNKELIYIGKSQCLSTRVYSSYFDKKAEYVRIMVTQTKADANIFEPYCIALYSPLHNCEFKTGDKPTFVLELPALGDFIKLEIVEK